MFPCPSGRLQPFLSTKGSPKPCFAEVFAGKDRLFLSLRGCHPLDANSLWSTGVDVSTYPHTRQIHVCISVYQPQIFEYCGLYFLQLDPTSF